MSISKLQNLIQSLGFATKKVEKTSPAASSGTEKTQYVPQPPAQPDEDSISLSLEGMIKQTTMEIKDESGVIREDKVRELSRKIASGAYQVNMEDVAKAIMYGKDAI